MLDPFAKLACFNVFRQACMTRRWGRDPYAYGAYSFLATGSSTDDYTIVSDPVGGGKVLFAGEATSGTYFQTVHGAYWTGQREAQRIISSNFATSNLC